MFSQEPKIAKEWQNEGKAYVKKIDMAKKALKGV